MTAAPAVFQAGVRQFFTKKCWIRHFFRLFLEKKRRIDRAVSIDRVKNLDALTRKKFWIAKSFPISILRMKTSMTMTATTPMEPSPTTTTTTNNDNSSPSSHADETDAIPQRKKLQVRKRYLFLLASKRNDTLAVRAHRMALFSHPSFFFLYLAS